MATKRATKPTANSRKWWVSDSDRDEAEALALKLKQEKVLAFLGAGVSMAAGYPDWRTLLDQLHDRICAQQSAKRTQPLSSKLRRLPDFLWRAQEYRDAISSDKRFRSELSRAMVSARRSSDAAALLPVRKILDLPFAHILTTNYDDSLERAVKHSRGLHRAFRVNWSGSRNGDEPVLTQLRNRDRRIIYLHGSLDKAASTILTNEDYRDFYLTTDRNSKQLFSIFATHCVCFLGFSLEDVHIQRVLEQVNALGQRRPSHYAILPDPGATLRAIRGRMLMRRYGVAPVYYALGSKGRGRHAGFTEVLDHLRSVVDKEEIPTPGGRAVPAPAFPRRLRKVVDPDDRNRGQFGGRPDRCGLRLSCRVTSHRGSRTWFNVHLEVKPVRSGNAPDGWKDGRLVKFYLHESFEDDVLSSRVRGGVARINVVAWGAFTAGALVDGVTYLELDLSKDEKAPLNFRMR